MNISIYPGGVLLEKAPPVTFPLTAEQLALIEEMKTEMENVQGVGIGATQVGSLLRLFILDKQIVGGPSHLVFINPVLTNKSEETAVGEEGCLSFPGISVKVKRHVGVTCSALDTEGKAFVIDAKDFYARAIQHEVDHLDGKLIIHYLGSAQRMMVMNKMKKFMRNAKKQAKEIMRHSSHQHG